VRESESETIAHSILFVHTLKAADDLE